MPTNANDPARVRNPAIELLLNHTATLTEQQSSHPRSVGLVIAGVLQGVGALVAGTSMTDPTGFVMRTLVGVGAEGLLFFMSRRRLR